MQNNTETLSKIYIRIDAAGKVAIRRWIAAVKKRIEGYSKAVQPESPFKDKPKFNKDSRKGQFWLRRDFRLHRIHIFGVSPNVSRVKGYRAPKSRYHKHTPYRFQTMSGRWMTLDKAQTTVPDPGVPYKAYYHGERVKPDAFFGLKQPGGVFGYGRVGAFGTPVHSDEDFATWLMETSDEEIARIIMETGQDILTDTLNAD